ncbi:MAG: recombinase family protein [Bacillota bacterium]
MKLGYVRVSAKDQNPERQIIKMKELGITDKRIFIDRATGSNFERPEYKAMKEHLDSGDILFVDSLDRLGRDYDGIIAEWKDITRNVGADIVVLENELFDSRKFREQGDIGKLMEDMFLSLLGYVAEQERKKIKQRQREGIEAAKLAGKPLGRPRVVDYPANWEKVYRRWENGQISVSTALDLLKLPKGTFYELVKRQERETGKTPKRWADGQKVVLRKAAK